jgi:hypothetical protein
MRNGPNGRVSAPYALPVRSTVTGESGPIAVESSGVPRVITPPVSAPVNGDALANPAHRPPTLPLLTSGLPASTCAAIAGLNAGMLIIYVI